MLGREGGSSVLGLELIWMSESEANRLGGEWEDSEMDWDGCSGLEVLAG